MSVMSSRPNSDWMQQLKKWDPDVIPKLEEGQKYHAFIAYAEVDEDINTAAAVYHTLKALNFKVFFYQEDALFGSERLETIHDAINASRRVIAIVSPNALAKAAKSGEAAHEFRFLYSSVCCKMINEGKVLIFPILKDTSERDLPFTAKYGNFVDYSRHPHTWFEELCQLLVVEGEFLGDVCPITDIGQGSAWSYISGYLRIISPFVREHIESWCLRTTSARPERVPLTQVSLKLVVVIPENGRIPVKFSDVDDLVEDVEGLTVVTRDRAGDIKREYTCSMHRVRGKGGNWFYFMGEFASILKTVHETMQSGLTTLNFANYRQQVLRFANTLELLPNYRQTQPVAEALHIIRYNDDRKTEASLSQMLLEVMQSEIAQR